jgi:hypothetical protein
MSQIIINNHIDPEVALYDGNDNYIGIIQNATALDDVRLQIFQQHLKGYYFIYNNEKINIDCYGNVEKWPDGCFDYSIKAAGEMLDVSNIYNKFKK